MAAINERIPDLDGEQVTAPDASIKKLPTFNENGGSVDLLTPEVDDEEVGQSDEANAERNELTEVRALIHDYQAMREETKLLEGQSERGVNGLH